MKSTSKTEAGRHGFLTQNEVQPVFGLVTTFLRRWLGKLKTFLPFETKMDRWH
jgi:hypothetical protein